MKLKTKRRITAIPKKKYPRKASFICIVEKEIYTENDLAEIKKSLAEMKRGEYCTHEEVMRKAEIRNISKVTKGRIKVEKMKPTSSGKTRTPRIKVETRLERRARRLKAANELLGIWADKDTSFFEEKYKP